MVEICDSQTENMDIELLAQRFYDEHVADWKSTCVDYYVKEVIPQLINKKQYDKEQSLRDFAYAVHKRFSPKGQCYLHPRDYIIQAVTEAGSYRKVTHTPSTTRQ